MADKALRGNRLTNKKKVGGIRPSDDPELIKLKMKKEKEDILRTEAKGRYFRGGKV
jgi:hypothetical protein